MLVRSLFKIAGKDMRCRTHWWKHELCRSSVGLESGAERPAAARQVRFFLQGTADDLRRRCFVARLQRGAQQERRLQESELRLSLRRPTFSAGVFLNFGMAEV